jgi:hypothetical protein
LNSLKDLLSTASTKILADPQNMFDNGKYAKYAKGAISQGILGFQIYQ